MTPVDHHQLDKLLGDCGDAAFVGSLVGRYRDLLPDRVASVLARVAEQDVAAAMDRVLSLKVASATVGARELASLAGRVETDLSLGALDDALLHAQQLPRAACRADGALAPFSAAAAG